MKINITLDQLLNILLIIGIFVGGYFTHFLQDKLRKKENISNRKIKELEKIDKFLEIINMAILDVNTLRLLENQSEKNKEALKISEKSIESRQQQIEYSTEKINTYIHQIEKNNHLIEIINGIDDEIIETKNKLLYELKSFQLEHDVIKSSKEDLLKFGKELEEDRQNLENINQRINIDTQAINKLKSNLEDYVKNIQLLDIDISINIIDPSGKLSKIINELIDLIMQEESSDNLNNKKMEIKKILINQVGKI